MIGVHDISAPLGPQLPTWPSSRGWSREFTNDLQRGDNVTESYLAMDVHCGTHVDAPLHHLSDGSPIETLPLDAFWGTCHVVDAREAATVDTNVVDRVPEDAERVLFLTDNSVLHRLATPEFEPKFVAIDLEAAQALAARTNLKLVGNDYLSVQPYGASDEVHRVLMRAGVALLEGVNLAGVEPGVYELSALPLALPGAEAAPARAVLRPLSAATGPQ